MLALSALNAYPAGMIVVSCCSLVNAVVYVGACGKAAGGSVLSRGYTNFGGESTSCLPQERL